jgi:hypothetical protein
LSDDQKFHVLRASLPTRGRALTLDEEVHPCSRLGNRGIQQAFLEILKTLLPLASHPIMVADSGFRMPFYRYVEHTLSWHWARCIRNRDFISWQNTTDSWFSATSLYSKAAAKPPGLGAVQWVRCCPLFSSWFARSRKGNNDAANRVSRVSHATVKTSQREKRALATGSLSIALLVHRQADHVSGTDANRGGFSR